MRHRFRLLLLAACTMLPVATRAQSPLAAEAEQIGSGFRFTEGPVWHDGALLFSDIPADTVYRWSPEAGTTVFRSPSHHSNGLALDAEGRLLLAQHGARRIARVEADGTETALATHYEGKRLNSPNDLALHPDGSIYFTDPMWGIRPEQAELDFTGVFRLAPDGTLHLLVDSLYRPNGITFSPDFGTLYVSTSDGRTVVSYRVSDHALAEGRLFAAFEGEGATDGLKTDADGRLYVTEPTGISVFDPDGALLQQVPIPINPTNCAWGPDGALYVTAGSSVYRIAPAR